MDLLSRQLEQIEKQFCYPDTRFCSYTTEDETVDNEGIRRLVKAVLVRELAELKLIQLFKAR